MPSTKPKALITGINGFVGSHLADLLVKQGYDLYGLVNNKDVKNIKHLKSHLTLFEGDVCDQKTLCDIIHTVCPDYTYHLAGAAFVPLAASNPELVYNVNTHGVLNLLEAMRMNRCSSRILIVTTSEVYGIVSEENLPIKESQPLAPVSYYGMTKACADLIAQQYASTFNMDVIRVRPFNHIGPRQSPNFVCSSFAKQIVEIEYGIKEAIIKVGNLNTFRDFTDVRDIVRGYQLIIEGAEKGDVYNIGSHRCVQISGILENLLQKSAASNIKVVQEASRTRTINVPMMYCDTSFIQHELDWCQEYDLSQTLNDILAYWREQLCPSKVCN